MRAAIGILFLIILAFASDNTHAVKVEILEKIFTNISMKKELLIWSDDKKLIEIFNKKDSFATTANCEDATLLILEDKSNLEKNCKNKPIFVLEYSLLKEIPQSFGAIFWKKGRPNIIIISPRAKELSIDVSQILSEYLEEKVW